MKEAMLIEASLCDLHTFVSASVGVRKIGWVVGLQLPFSRDASIVPGLLHKVSKSSFLGIKDSKVCPVSVVVLTGHYLDSGGSTKRLRISMCEPKPASS